MTKKKLCAKCNKKGKHKLEDAYYCDRHYHRMLYKTDNIVEFLEQNNYNYHRHAIDKDLILTDDREVVRDFCLAFDKETWLFAGNNKNTRYIQGGK